ncbi:hypothetical protein CBR_g29500 [Chara braunii]|uniref:Protein kinase domain-containing protein n=1 Tax=Chara braunii TaxID=69332 RepID=A0A388LAY2_CHABU|nr:hypothetical protein CBR_g29500 [Chara braunii]|eukprot:GBG79352.1 hypothetical protein CBR_g29500 [Chara braunii]
MTSCWPIPCGRDSRSGSEVAATQGERRWLQLACQVAVVRVWGVFKGSLEWSAPVLLTAMARSGGLATSAHSSTASRSNLKTPRRAVVVCTTSSSSGESKTETRSSSSGSSSSGLGDSTAAISSGSGETKETIHSLMEGGRRALQSRPPFVVQGTGRVSLGGPQQKSVPTAGSAVVSATPRANSARVRRAPETPANASSSSGSSLPAPSSDLGAGSAASTMNSSSSASKASRRLSVPSFQVASPPSSLAARTPRTADLSARSTPCPSSKSVKPTGVSISCRQSPRSASKTSTCNGSGSRTASVVGPKAGSVAPRGLSKVARTVSTGSPMVQSTKMLSGGAQEGEGSPPGMKAPLQQAGKKTNIPQYSWTKQVVSSQQTGGKALTRNRKSVMTRPASAAVLGNSNANGCCRSTYPANGWLTERVASSAVKAREPSNMRTTLATPPNSARSHYPLQDQQRTYHLQHHQPAPQQSNSHSRHPHHPTPPQQQQSHQHQVQAQQQYQQLQNRWSASGGQMCAANGIVNNSVTPIAVVPLASSSGASTMISHFHTPSPDGRVQQFASPIMLSSQSTGGTLSPQVIQSLQHQHQHPPILQLNHRSGQHNENQGSAVMSAQTHRCVSASKIRPPGVPMHQYVVSPTQMCMPGVNSCVHPGQPLPRQGWVAQSTPTPSSHLVVPSTQAVNPPTAPKASMQAVVTVTSRHAPAVSSTVPRALSSLPVRQMPHPPVPLSIPPAIGLPQSARLDSARLSRLPGYTIGPVVGEGGFCKVRLGTHQLTSAKVAIKIIDKARLVDPADRKRVAREIKVLKRLTQGTIIQLLEVVESPTRVHVIMEYASGGSLLDYVRARKKLEESEARRFLVQIVRGLEHCHSRMVVHRDIKLENLLLDSEKNMKIIDFGLSAILTAGKKLRVHCGSPSYAAPEIVARKLYDGPPVDVWSLGVVLFAMISGYLPFYAGSSKEDLCQKIINGSYRAPDWISNESRDLLAGMLTTDPAQRLTLTQVNQHSWVRGTKTPGAPLPPPPLLVEFIPGTSDQVRLDDDVLKELEVHGLDRESTRESLRRSEHNYATATYYLLALRKHYRKRKELVPNGPASENDSSQSQSVVPTLTSLSTANASVSSVGKSTNIDGGSESRSITKGSFGKVSFCGKVRASPQEGVSKWVAGIPAMTTHMVSASPNGGIPSVGVTSVCGNEIVVLSRQMPMRMPLVGAQGTVV